MALDRGENTKRASTYAGVHNALIRLRGSAVGLPCYGCGRPARGWMRVGPATHIGRNTHGKTVKWSTDPDAYRPGCASCNARARPRRLTEPLPARPRTRGVGNHSEGRVPGMPPRAEPRPEPHEERLMGFTTLDRMKDALLGVPVSPLERIVLLDMAVAVPDDGVPVYTWGHDRLARALGGSPAARRRRARWSACCQGSPAVASSYAPRTRTEAVTRSTAWRCWTWKGPGLSGAHSTRHVLRMGPGLERKGPRFRTEWAPV